MQGNSGNTPRATDCLMNCFGSFHFHFIKMSHQSIHIGRAVLDRITEIGMSKAEFGRRIHTSRQNINALLNKHSMDVKQLAKISEVLRFDFLSLLSPKPSPEISGRTGRYFVLVEIDKDERDEFMHQFP